MDRERIEELLQRTKLSQAEKAEVTAAADAAGIKYRIKRGCNTRCYEQILVQLYEMSKPERNVSRDGWRLKSALCSFALRGKVINNANIAEVTVGGLHPLVRDTFFEKVTDDGQNG
ncbi:MAG: hypothetical protein II120_00675 [Bacteroidales bacterium]|nr:hypothetical protein [Bacteroidales bacterium]